MSTKDLLLYVNIPFCRSKCHFCDWVSDVGVSDLRLPHDNPRRRAYIDALVRQINHYGPLMNEAGYVARIMYWGGGTASVLAEQEIRAVIGAIRQNFSLAAIDEATIEGSPDSFTFDQLCLFHEVGFNRVSIGVQSLDDDRLRALGRSHDASEAVRAVADARRAGFLDINIDLISGFPGETVDEFERSLKQVLELPFDHASVYPYRPAQSTVLRRQLNRGTRDFIRLGEQLAAFSLCQEMMAKAGRAEYCFGHFGEPKSRSDMAYFKLEMDWIGFGSRTSSLYNQRCYGSSSGTLDHFTQDPTRYDEDMPAASPQAVHHMLYQALSTPEGAVRSLWSERTGVDLEEILKLPPAMHLLKFLKQNGPLIVDDEGVRVPRERIAREFITLLFLNAPQEAQKRDHARVIMGGY